MELKYYSWLVTEDKLAELYSETINQMIDELSKSFKLLLCN